MQGRERGLLLRLSASIQGCVVAALTIYAVVVPSSFGISTSVKVVVGATLVVVHVFDALLPWQRWMAERDRPYVVRVHMALSVAVLSILMVRHAGATQNLLWATALVLVYSGILLRLREHVAITFFLLGLAVWIRLASGGAIAPVPLIVLPAIALLSGFGSAIVERARTVEATGRERAERSESALRAVADSLGDSITGDRQKILDATVQAAADIRNDMAGVYWLTPDGRHATYAATVGIPDEQRNRLTPVGNGLMGEVQRRGETVVWTDYQTAETAMPQYVDMGLEAGIGTPLRRHGEVIGMLVGGRRAVGAYSDEEVAAFDLLGRNAERALEMSEQVLADRRVLAHLREIDRMKHDFVTTVSHELRTPLTIINGITETLVRHQSSLPEDQLGLLLGRLHTNAESLTAIVKTLLDTAAIDQGILLAHLEPFEATTVVSGAIDRLRGLFSDNHLNLMADSEVEVLGDAALIERVIDNLIVNAQRHTPAGIHVTVRVTQLGNECEVAVLDDGPGIPAEDQDRILQRFERGGSPNERPRGGLGLGLSLCAEILKLHHAELNLTSTPGRTMFAFRLPLARHPAADAVELPPPIPSTTGYPMDGTW